MNFKIKRKKTAVVCYIEGDVDIDTAPALKKEFASLIASKSKKIILNFNKLNFIDSLGVATLLWLFKNIKKVRGEVALSNIAPKIRSVFSITKLDKVFKIFESEEEALKAFGITIKK